MVCLYNTFLVISKSMFILFIIFHAYYIRKNFITNNKEIQYSFGRFRLGVCYSCERSFTQAKSIKHSKMSISCKETFKKFAIFVLHFQIAHNNILSWPQVTIHLNNQPEPSCSCTLNFLF